MVNEPPPFDYSGKSELPIVFFTRYQIFPIGSEFEDVLFLVIERRPIFAGLVEQSLSHRDIVELTDASQATASRLLHQLLDIEMVSGHEHPYELTLLGELIFENVATCLERFDRLDAAADILSELPGDTEFSPSLLQEVEVELSVSPCPRRELILDHSDDDSGNGNGRPCDNVSPRLCRRVGGD